MAATKALLLTLVAAAIACRIVFLQPPRAEDQIRARLRFGRSHPLPNLQGLEEWLEEYVAYQELDSTPKTPEPDDVTAHQDDPEPYQVT